MTTNDQQVPRPPSARGARSENTKFPLFMEDTAYPNLVDLLGHQLSLPDQEQSDAVNIPVFEWDRRDKRVVTRMVPTTRKIVTRVGVEIGMPAWDHSIIDEIVHAKAMRAFMTIRYDCEYCDRRANLFVPTTALDDVVLTENMSIGGIDPTEELIGRTTGFSSLYIRRYLALSGRIVFDGANPLLAVAWMDSNDCSDAGLCPGGVYVAGSQEDEEDTLPFLSAVTTDAARFDTLTEIATALPVGSIVTDLLRINNVLIGTYADDIAPGTATTGGVFIYKDGTVTIGKDGASPLASALYALARQGDRVIAVGKAGKIFTAKINNLLIGWSNISINPAPVYHLLDIGATDNVAYIGTSSGEALTLIGSLTTVITTSVDPTNIATSLSTVRVLDGDHVVFGGDGGFWSENRHADSGGAWTVSILNGGVGTIGAIAGDTWRQLFAIDDVFYERSLLTADNGVMEFREFDLLAGQVVAGDITAIESLEWLYGPNVFVAVTDAGQIIYFQACVMFCE